MVFLLSNVKVISRSHSVIYSRVIDEAIVIHVLQIFMHLIFVLELDSKPDEQAELDGFQLAHDDDSSNEQEENQYG